MAEYKILVVDDDATTLELLTVVLEKERFKTSTATTGWDGLVQARAEKPDLILLDILLPELTGTDALHTLKAMESTKHIPVIMFTAKSEKDIVLDAKFSGIADYIIKPFDNTVLLKKIRKALGIQETDTQNADKVTQASTPPPSPVEEKPKKATSGAETKKQAVQEKNEKTQEPAAEDTVDMELQEKILKTQYCATEDHKMSELQPFEQVMSMDIKAGMILAMPLLYTNKRPFLSTGTQLTQKHIEKIKEKIGELVFPVSVRKKEAQNG